MAYIDDAARVAETSTTTGTGDFALAGAYDFSYRRFSAVCATSDTVPYTIVADDGKWEHGLGTYSAANTLTRTTVFQNSLNTTALITFAAGAKVVFLGDPSMARSISGADAKSTPIDADKIGYWDSVSSALRSMSWANLKAALKTYFDSLTTTLTNKTITGLKGTKVAMGASDIDLSAGDIFTKTVAATITLTISNVPSTGTTASFILELTNGGSQTINYPTGSKYAGGTAPTLTAAGKDVLGAYTHDGGTTWNWLVLGKDVK